MGRRRKVRQVSVVLTKYLGNKCVFSSFVFSFLDSFKTEVEGAALLLPEVGEGGRRPDIQEDQSTGPGAPGALTDHCPLSVGEDIQEDQSTGALSVKLLDLPGRDTRWEQNKNVVDHSNKF